MTIEWVGLDADDTLWHSEGVFQDTQAWFCERLEPFCDPDTNLVERLDAVERRNIPLLGYGVKAFTLSMVEAAVDITGGRVPATVPGRPPLRRREQGRAVALVAQRVVHPEDVDVGALAPQGAAHGADEGAELVAAHGEPLLAVGDAGGLDVELVEQGV